MLSEFCPRDGGRFEGETGGIRGDFIFSSFDGFVAVLTDCTDYLQAELATTKAELAASEAVVREQVSTEGSLFAMGEELQGEVHGRRDDVTKLLAKVAR